MSRQMGATEFKAKCPGVLDEVEKNKAEIIITRRGKPIARLVPIPEEPLFGRMKGTVQILGDIVGPTVDLLDDPDYYK
jgi:prevent-host-death family protein